MLHRSLLFLILASMAEAVCLADGEALVDFQKHVQPILENRCLECHGPEEAKNGFRVDEMDDLLAYLEPGDVEASSLWSDYLRTDDPDMLMPPPSATHSGGLPVSELLVMKVWIDEGAEGQWSREEKSGEEEPEEVVPESLVGKIWAFQGLFHPASVHFPVALLSVSALFVFLSFFRRETCEPVAFHCLWIGALGAVAACLAGWSYAVYRGYGTGVGFDFENSAIDRHRWVGVFVALLAMLTVPLAAGVRRHGGLGKRVLWLFASCIIALSVSVAGFQGGELTYGEGHYWNYYQQLFGTDSSAESSEDDSEEAPTDWSEQAPEEESESGDRSESVAEDDSVDSIDNADGNAVDSQDAADEESQSDQPQTDDPQSDDPQSDQPQTDQPQSDDPQSDDD